MAAGYGNGALVTQTELGIVYQPVKDKVSLFGAAKGLGFGAGGNYVGDSWFNATNTFTLPGYTLVNASIFYDHPKYSLNLKMNNLLDEQYRNTNTLAQKTRNIAASVSLKS